MVNPEEISRKEDRPEQSNDHDDGVSDDDCDGDSDRDSEDDRGSGSSSD